MRTLPQKSDGPPPAGASRAGAPTAEPLVTVEPDPEDLRIAVLVRAIELEVVPRLMLAHRSAVECLEPPALRDARVSDEDIEQFTRLVLVQDESLAQACIQALRTRGVPIETLYLDLLTPVARRLGTMWEEDLCDFTDVTLGLGRLHQVLQTLGSSAEPPPRPTIGRRVLLLPAPGEQHTFGLVMVAEMFRRSGWDVEGGPTDTEIRPVARVRSTWYDVIGFSMAAEVHLDALRSCICEVRAAALNKRVGIMAGGPLFNRQPELAAFVGADATVANGRDAPGVAEALLARLALGAAGTS